MRNILIKISNIGEVLSANAFNALNDEMENIVVSASIALDPNLGPDTDLNMLGKTVSSYANISKLYIDSGIADVYQIDVPGILKTISGYYDGLVIIFKPINVNTGASTVKLGSLAIKDLKYPDGTALDAGLLAAEGYALAAYNLASDRFELFYPIPFATSAGIEAHTATDKLVSPANLKVIEDKFYPTGIIRLKAVSIAIFGYETCNGQAISRTTFSDLFALIGTTFGIGDGSTTFNIPNILILQTAFTTQTSLPVASGNAISVDSSNNDVWAGDTTDIYKLTGGLGSWVDTTTTLTAKNWTGVAVNSSNGDVWGCEDTSFNIYKSVGGVDTWTDALAPGKFWTGIAVDPSNGDVFGCETGTSKIYKRTGGVGAWTDQTAPIKNWTGIAVNSSNGDVWACETTTSKIYKRIGGVGAWIDQVPPVVAWSGISVNSDNGDVWACEGLPNKKIYRQAGGIGAWIDQLPPSEAWAGISVNSNNGDVWACVIVPFTADVYKSAGLAKYMIKT